LRSEQACTVEEEAFVLGWLRKKRLSEAARRRLVVALARAEEEIIETHVESALDVLDSVGEDIPVQQVIDLYLDTFDPGEPRSSIVERRVLARLESRGLRRTEGRRRRR
jgi:hypothetical protein